MANPTTQPSLQERALRLVQTLQFVWFVGHVSTLFFTARYGLYYITMKTNRGFAGFSYRTAFASALVTYGIVVFKGFRARGRQGKPSGAFALAQDENVQYLAMAAVWIFSRQIPLALLPFIVYSIFHVATYFRSNILPVFQPPTATPNAAAGQAGRTKASGPLADGIGRFIKEYYDGSMTLVAVLEIVLWFRLLGSALLFTKGSWIILAIYSVFLRARVAQSSFVQGAIANLSARGDALFANKSANPQVRGVWEQAKGAGKSLHDVTDFQRYAGARGAEPKKAQ